MPGFSDDFERANGSLGGDWAIVSGSWSIVDGEASCPAGGIASPSVAEGAGAHTVTLTLVMGVNKEWSWQAVVKLSDDGTQYYSASLRVLSNQFTAYIQWIDGGSYGTLNSVTISEVITSPWTLAFTYDSGALSVSVNGTERCTASDSRWAAHTKVGMRSTPYAYTCDEFSTNLGAAATFAVSPDAIGDENGATVLTLSGTGTEWTPGTPGSPEFTADAGTLTGQEVLTDTSAQVIFTPPAAPATVTITDPSTGLTDTITVVEGTYFPGTGGECKITDAAAPYINNAPLHDKPVFLHTDMDIGYPNTQYSVGELLYSLFIYLTFQLNGDMTTPLTEPPYNPRLDYIWNAINGGVEQPVGLWTPTTDPPVKVDTENIRAELEALTANYTDLAEVVGILGGSPTVYSHVDLKTAIELINNQDVLDAITAMRGSAAPTLTDITEMIQQLSTIAGYNLGDVLDAIGALNPATAPGLAAALATIMGSLGALALEVAAIGAAETADAASSSAGAASSAAALAWILANGPYILDTLADLQALLAASGNAAPHPPVWPGLANVDLGAPVDLATTNTLAGPMHGVLLDIISADPGTNRYLYDTVPAWKNIGALSFFTDTGHHETYQALSFAQALYVPKTMAVAGGVRVFHGRGPQGTIRPWSYKA